MDEFVAFLSRVEALIPPFGNLVVAFCFIAGIVLTIRGILLAGRAGEGLGALGRGGGWMVLGHFVVGALLIALPSTIESSVATLFGSNEIKEPSMIFAYAPQMLEPVSTEAARKIIVSLLYVIQFIGLVGLVRGLFLLNQAPSHPGQGLVGRGTTHLVGGAFAMNIVVFVSMVEKVVIG